MKVELAATRTCHYCHILEAELKELGVDYTVHYLEDEPELQGKVGSHSSPNILVNGKVVFRGIPTLTQLEQFIQS
jgi:glutaredoxin